MSYDVSLHGEWTEEPCVCPCCDNQHVARTRVCLWSGNMTSNVAPMWRNAGIDLKTFDNARADDMIPKLRIAIAEMEAKPFTFAAMNPENGWGDNNGALRFLREILAACEESPNATIMVGC